MTPENKHTPPAMTTEDLLSRLQSARPDDMIRITRYPDGAEVIELFPPPWRPEVSVPNPAERRPLVPKFRFEESEDTKGMPQVPDWLRKVAPEPKDPPGKKKPYLQKKASDNRTEPVSGNR